MVHLLNSAVMPQKGYYQLHQQDQVDWVEELVAHYNETKDEYFRHYIGYESTLAFVRHLTGLWLPEANKDKTVLENKDYLYIIRLKYRVTSFEKKQDNPHPDDFEFFSGRYFDTSIGMISHLLGKGNNND